MNIDLSSLKNRLSKTPTIIGRDRFFNSSVLVPFVEISGEYHLLFQKRAKSIRQGNEICFPGGKFDKKVDKCYQCTAIRETIEEIGIDRNKIEVLGSLGTLISPMAVAIDAYLALFKSIDDLSINSEEVERVFTVPLSFFINNPPEEYHAKIEASSSYINSEGNRVTLLPVKKLGLPDRYLNSWGSQTHRVLVYKTEEEVIWGLTAEIINELITLI